MPKLGECKGVWLPGPYFGLAKLQSTYSHTLKEFLKEFPGRKWLAAEKCWLVPTDVIPIIEAAFPEYSWSSKLEPAKVKDFSLDSRLLPHQTEGVEKVLESRCTVLQFDTGTGKSPTALQAACKVDAQRILIVSPANVVEDWKIHIQDWGGGSEDEIGVFTATKKDKEQKKYTIATYGLLKHVLDFPFDYIIFDELHYLLKATSARSKVAAEISKRNANAIRVGLTATPVSSELYNIWHQVDVLCPGKLGTYWQFIFRYFDTDNEGYEGALQILGLNDKRAAELNQRLRHFTSVVYKTQVAAYLPPLETALNWYGGTKWKAHQISMAAWKQEQAEYANERIKQAAEIGAAPKRLFATYMRSSAEAAAKALGVPFVHGGSTPKARRKALINNDCAVVTMDSVREGVNYLTKFTDIHLLETYPAPIKIIQFMGRFNRLNSSDAARITIHGLRGSSDEIVCARLHNRLEQQKKLWEGGVVAQLADTLSIDTDSDEFITEINEAVLCMVEDDGFGDGDE